MLTISALRIAAAKLDLLTVDTDACVLLDITCGYTGEYCTEGYSLDIFTMFWIPFFTGKLNWFPWFLAPIVKNGGNRRRFSCRIENDDDTSVKPHFCKKYVKNFETLRQMLCMVTIDFKLAYKTRELWGLVPEVRGKHLSKDFRGIYIFCRNVVFNTVLI